MTDDLSRLVREARPYTVVGDPAGRDYPWTPNASVYTSPIWLPRSDRVHLAPPLCACTARGGALLCRRHGPLRHEVAARRWLLVDPRGYELVRPGAVLHTELRPTPIRRCAHCDMAWDHHVGVDHRCLTTPFTFVEGDRFTEVDWQVYQLPGLALGNLNTVPVATTPTVTFKKSKEELLAYQDNITKIIEEYSLKESDEDVVLYLLDRCSGWGAVRLYKPAYVVEALGLAFT